jgi:methylglyoxal synthase
MSDARIAAFRAVSAGSSGEYELPGKDHLCTASDLFALPGQEFGVILSGLDHQGPPDGLTSGQAESGASPGAGPRQPASERIPMPDLAPAPAGRRIALIAHDNKKRDMLEWAGYNLDLLAGHELFATATTGHLLQEQLGLPVTCFRSGPYGGDQQIGARIAEGEIDLLVFLWDPLEPHPHDPDVKALLRVAVVCNIPVACNRATADFMISSPLMGRSHQGRDPASGQARHNQAALKVARAG